MSWTTVVKRIGIFAIVMIVAVIAARGKAADPEASIPGQDDAIEQVSEAGDPEVEAIGRLQEGEPWQMTAHADSSLAAGSKEDDESQGVSNGRQEAAESQGVTTGRQEDAAIVSGDIEVRHEAAQSQDIEQGPSRVEQEVREVYEVVATGYYAGVESTGKSPGHPSYGITYSGVKVRRGAVSTIAADPRVFPIGTVLYIPGYGYGVVADIGGAVKGHVIDLYFHSKEDIYSQWGKKTVKVVVVEEGDGKLDEQKFQYLESLFRDRLPPPSAM